MVAISNVTAIFGKTTEYAADSLIQAIYVPYDTASGDCHRLSRWFISYEPVLNYAS